MGFTYHEIFDSERLEELYEGDMETVLLMFDSFVNGVLPEIPKLKEYSEEEKWQDVMNQAHKFLPTFAMLGLVEIHMDLREIEDLCKEGKYHHVPKKVNAVDEKVNKIKPIVKKEYKRIQTYMQA